jgi:predicted transcriptional regulator
MVKKNAHKTAETDLHNAVVLTAIDITGDMVKRKVAEINQIPVLVDQIVKAFSNSAAMSGIAISSAPAATVTPVLQETMTEPDKRKKRELSGPAREAMLARMAKARAARGKKTEAPADVAPEAPADIAPESPETPVVAEQSELRRGPGRPRKAPQAKPEPFAHADSDRVQRKLDRAFRQRNPAKCTVKQSLNDIGDGKMTCLIDGKRVSFLETHLKRTYGMTFVDYSRIYKLPADYPTTPPKFKAGKQQDAKRLGLGTVQMRQAHKEKLAASAGVDAPVESNETTAETPVVVARPSGRARRVKVVDVNAVSAAA